jgi:hypothetical protein
MIPHDMPGYFSFNPDYVEPRDYCKVCGEVLIAGGCDNCAEAIRETVAAQFQQLQGSEYRIPITAESGAVHAADSQACGLAVQVTNGDRR